MSAIRTILATLAVALLTLLPSAIAEANTPSDWKHHIAFDCQPKKIMDGERYTYILVHQ